MVDIAPTGRSQHASAAAQALGAAAADVEEYLGHAAVFVRMADVWYDKLYQHNVFGRTASDVGVTAQLDEVMNQIMARASDGAKADTAAAVARAAFAALVTTLLHGGVFRNFTSDDADLLRRDVRDLRVRRIACIVRRCRGLGGAHVRLSGVCRAACRFTASCAQYG